MAPRSAHDPATCFRQFDRFWSRFGGSTLGAGAFVGTAVRICQAPFAAPRSERSTMSKDKNTKSGNDKKPAQKTLKEKRQAKKAKKV
jgi:hypothetical protein